jgi:pantetheine-phosphate adenylyltransferase
VTRVLYPGSFDPVHNGHVEIIETAADLFDEVIVAVVHNPQKGAAMFEPDERVAIVEECTARLPNVSALTFASLVVDLAREVEADFIVKGLRTVADFESELQQSQLNLAMTGVRTMFIPSATTHSFVASKWIREISRLGGDVTSMVPAPVAKRLAERFSS